MNVRRPVGLSFAGSGRTGDLKATGPW